MAPIWPATPGVWEAMVNQTLCNPVVMACNAAPGVSILIGSPKKEAASGAAGSKVPIELSPLLTNQTLPSGATVMAVGRLGGVVVVTKVPVKLVPTLGNSWIAPFRSTRPILLDWVSVNQIVPSGPTAIPVGWLP